MNKSVIGIAFLALSIFIVSLLVVNNQQSQDTRSKAAEEVNIAIPTVIPAPKTTLQTPFLRLVSFKDSVAKGEKIPIEIYAQTDSVNIAEARISLRYDSNVLSIDEADIENLGVLPVMAINTYGAQEINFSLFITEEAGYQPISFQKEQPIARIHARVKENASGATVLELDSQESGIYPPRSLDGSISADVLASTEGVILTIQ